METVSITSKNTLSLEDINYLLSQHWRVEGAGRDRLVVQEQGSRVYIHLDTTEQIADVVPKLLLDYSDISLIKKVIPVLADNPEFMIDDDFGSVFTRRSVCCQN